MTQELSTQEIQTKTQIFQGEEAEEAEDKEKKNI